MKDKHSGKRRLIGVDLAWGERSTTGCAELAWDGNGLALKCFKLLRSMEDIVKWIEPNRGDWVIAVDAPIIIRNERGRRPAEDEANKHYRYPFEAGPYPSNLNLPVGKSQRGGQLLVQLRESGGELVESAAHLEGQRLVFETYPHIAMVELFHLRKSIKYKSGWIDDHYPVEERFDRQLEGQQELVGHIREHLCSSDACPRLLPGGKLDELLSRPASSRTRADLKRCEDLLDGLVCAYTAAWLDIGGDLVGLGKVRKGVMITPRAQGIGPLLP